MKTIGCFTILEKEHRILLVKRRDVPFWDLPGGRLDTKETLEACAIREVLEETGYECEISNLVGTYKRPKFNDTQYVFKGNIIAGLPITQGDETKTLHWFSRKRLPLCMIPNRRKQIKDAMKHHAPIHETLHDRHILFLLWKIQKKLKKK